MDLRQLQADYLANERKVTLEKLCKGALIRTILSDEEGLVFNDGRTEKPKRLIVIGIDKSNAICFGSILVNTNLNPRAEYSMEYLSAQYVLSCEKYPDFLDYDSYVDCGELFSIPISKLLTGEYFGVLLPEDESGIWELLETTDTLTTKEKKRFGIRRR